MIDKKQLAEYAKGKTGKKGLPEMIKGKYGMKGKGELQKWAKEEEQEHEHSGKSHELSEEQINEICDRVEAGKGDPHLMDMAEGVTPETNPPQWIEDEDIWEKAKTAADKSYDDTDELYYPVVTHIYKAMGGGISGGKGKGHGKGGLPFQKKDKHDDHEEDDHDEDDE